MIFTLLYNNRGFKISSYRGAELSFEYALETHVFKDWCTMKILKLLATMSILLTIDRLVYRLAL